jgi:hypothetical protein
MLIFLLHEIRGSISRMNGGGRGIITFHSSSGSEQQKWRRPLGVLWLKTDRFRQQVHRAGGIWHESHLIEVEKEYRSGTYKSSFFL